MYNSAVKQEAQLSQRDYAVLHVTQYFTKSPWGHSKWHHDTTLLVFHCNYVCMSYRLWDIQCQNSYDLEIWVRGYSRS